MRPPPRLHRCQTATHSRHSLADIRAVQGRRYSAYASAGHPEIHNDYGCNTALGTHPAPEAGALSSELRGLPGLVCRAGGFSPDHKR